MTRSLIDTDILSYYLKGDDSVSLIMSKYLEKYHKINISVITYYEILKGLYLNNAHNKLKIFLSFVKYCNIYQFDSVAAYHAAGIFSSLKKRGRIISDLDIQIAGTALSNKLVLVTNNTKHFSRIDKLKLDNWKH